MAGLVGLLPGKGWLALALAFSLSVGAAYVVGRRDGVASEAAQSLALRDRELHRSMDLLGRAEALRQMVITIQEERFNVVQRDYRAYVRGNHSRVTYDAERLRIKAAAIDAANAGRNADGGAVQATGASR